MRLSIFAAAAVALALPLAARADLAGDTVHVTYNYPDQATVYGDLGTYTVPGSGSVFGEANFQITPTQIILTSTIDNQFLQSQFNGIEFTDTSSDPGITGVTLDPSSTFKLAEVSFTSNQVLVNFGIQPDGSNILNGQTLIYDLSFAPPVTPPPSSVTPEPSSIALLGTGLLGTVGMLRRRFAQA